MGFSISGYVGRQTLRSGNHLLELAAFGYRIAGGFFRQRPGDKKAFRRCLLEEVFFSCIEALRIVVPAALLIGAALMLYLSRVSEQFFLGKAILFVIVREVGPALTALLVILRSSPTLTGEILCMRVCEAGGNPSAPSPVDWQTVCSPRIFGLILSLLLLFIVFDVVAIFGGFAAVWIGSDILLGDLPAQIGKALVLTDIAVPAAKAFFFGTLIGVTSLFYGFKRQPEMFAVPRAASRAAMESFFYCLVANIGISAAFY